MKPNGGYLITLCRFPASGIFGCSSTRNPTIFCGCYLESLPDDRLNGIASTLGIIWSACAYHTEGVLKEKISIAPVLKGERLHGKDGKAYARGHQSVRHSAAVKRSREPEDFAFLASLLKRYGKEKALCNGRRVHCHISKCGYDNNTFLGNYLIQMYGTCGRLDEAQNVFDKIACPNLYSWNILLNAYGQNGYVEDARSVFCKMSYRDVVSWNTMITIFSQNARGKDALDFFHWMQLEDTKPDNVTFVSALDACASLTALEEGDKIHIAIVHMGYERDVVVGNALINMYGKCGTVSDARSVFNRLCHPTVISWTTMIAAFTQSGNGKDALHFLWQMQLEGVMPNAITFVSGLDACASHAALKEGREIHAAIVNTGHKQELLVGNALINMYGKCRSVCDARSMFSKMPHRDSVSWNAMIATCSQNDNCRDALNLFHQMQSQGIQPDSITFVCALDACASLAALEEGKQIHFAIIVIGCEERVVVGNALVSMYGSSRSVHEAKSVFDRMPHRDVVSWNSMVNAFAQSEHGKEALDFFRQMQLQGFKADKITFFSALDACNSMAALQDGWEIHAAIVISGHSEDDDVRTALVDMYGKSGCLLDARDVFGRMRHRSVVSWTAIISANALKGNGNVALDLFYQMQLEGVQPDTVIFVSILNACSHAGLVDEGKYTFVSMSRDHGLSHTIDHYLSMVDLFGRAGRLDEAEDLTYKMPFEETSVLWRCLLGACRIHGDLQRGIRVANNCFQLEPKSASPYVLLSNIYAEAILLLSNEYDSSIDNDGGVCKCSKHTAPYLDHLTYTQDTS